MNLSLFSSSDLRRLADLVARKEEYLAAAARIDSELAAITDPAGVPNLPALPAPSKAAQPERPFVEVVSSPVRPGSVGEQILGVLSNVGPEGAHLREIAEAVARPVSSVNVWLSAETRRRRFPVRRVGVGRYALKSANGSRAHSPAGRSTPLRDAILAVFKAHPGESLNYEQLTKHTGLNRRAVQCWISARRHDFPQLAKVGVGLFVWKP